MIEPLQTGSSKESPVPTSGKLHDEDYRTFVPAAGTTVAKGGEVRVFVHCAEDFQGWDLLAAWDDIKFAAAHYSDFDHIAMVGDKKWEEWMARLCTPFTQASVRYFDVSEGRG